MSLDADLIVDRRRMRRKLTFWRVLAVFVAIVAIVALAATVAARRRRPHGGRRLHRAREDHRADPQRPGAGGVAREARQVERQGGHRAHRLPGRHDGRLRAAARGARRVAAAKPLVVVVDGLAASGGYIAAMSADHIVAQDTSLVGSIGVLFQYPNVSDLLKTIGVKVEEIKSSPLKAAPNGFEPTSPEARAAIEALVKDSAMPGSAAWCATAARWTTRRSSR